MALSNKTVNTILDLIEAALDRTNRDAVYSDLRVAEGYHRQEINDAPHELGAIVGRDAGVL